MSLITSPLAVILGLTPLAMFSEGKTYVQFKNVFDMDKEWMNRVIPKVVKILNGDQGTAILEFATMTFFHEPFIFTEKFKTTTEAFGAVTQSFNFTNTTLAVDTVNSWISNKTHGMINFLVEPNMFHYPLTMMFANTIYFKDSWDNAFSVITSGVFYSSRGRKHIKFLAHVGMYEFWENSAKNFQVLVKRFTNPKFSCIFILPDSRNGLLNLIADIAQEKKLMNIIRRKYELKTVNATLPMISVRSIMDAGLILNEMGIRNLYTNSVFKGVLIKPNGLSDDDRVAFNRSIHGAYVSMNQYGTEAAAATLTIMSLSTIKPSDNFTADHPYVFIIVREETVLFIGCYDGPR